VLLGSRQGHKASEAANRARAISGSRLIFGMENDAAATESEIVIVAVPSLGHRSTVCMLAPVLKEKHVLDITVPIAFNPLRYAPPNEGSNALETERLLGGASSVACGFHTVSSTILSSNKKSPNVDTLIAGNNSEIKSFIMKMSKDIGIHAYDAGSLIMSPILEGLTPMLIGMNKKYGSNNMGIQITGIS
jgi:hypothetical protein